MLHDLAWFAAGVVAMYLFSRLMIKLGKRSLRQDKYLKRFFDSFGYTDLLRIKTAVQDEIDKRRGNYDDARA